MTYSMPVHLLKRIKLKCKYKNFMNNFIVTLHELFINSSCDKTFEMILLVTKDDLFYNFNDDIISAGCAKSKQSDTLKIKDLKIQNLDEDINNFRKKRVEDYVAFCVAFEKTDEFKKEKDIFISEQQEITDDPKNNNDNEGLFVAKSVVSNKTPSVLEKGVCEKSTISQKTPSIRIEKAGCGKSIISQKTPSIRVEKSIISQNQTVPPKTYIIDDNNNRCSSTKNKNTANISSTIKNEGE